MKHAVFEAARATVFVIGIGLFAFIFALALFRWIGW